MKIERTMAIILVVVMLITGMTVNADTSIGEKAMSIIKNQLEILRLQAKNVQSFVAIMEDLIPLVLSELKDIKESDWFTENVALLYGMNIVQGDGAGHFNGSGYGGGSGDGGGLGFDSSGGSGDSSDSGFGSGFGYDDGRGIGDDE